MKIREQRIEKFLEGVGSSASTPGGGAVAAVAGATAAALVEMVGNLTENSNKELKRIVKKAKEARAAFLDLADEDVAAFNKVMAAYRITKKNKTRGEKIQKALQGATEVPLKTAKLANDANRLAKEILKVGNKNAASDAKTAIYLSEASKKSALENVEINLIYIKDPKFVDRTKKEIRNL